MPGSRRRSSSAAPGRIPWHARLRTRLLAVSVLIAFCAVAATAWLAVNTTTAAIRQRQPVRLADDATIYSTLLHYASTHSSWAGVQGVVNELARRSGRQIRLTTTKRQPIATTSAGGGTLPPRPSATVNPLQVDTALAPHTGADGIDAQAVGPFLLPRAQRRELTAKARGVVACLRQRRGDDATIETSPSGRPLIHVTGDDPRPHWASSCGMRQFLQPTPTEAAALTALDRMVNKCLGKADRDRVRVNLDFTWWTAGKVGDQPPTPLVRFCIDSSRRAQLRPYVAAPALLFVTGPPAPAARVRLSAGGRVRIAEVSAAILLLAVLAAIVLSARLVGPLSRLTSAVQDPAGPRQRLPVTSNDEIGRLTAAFNDFAERRRRLEAQRSAMVSDIAHELRTPLGNIRGWLEAAEDGLVVTGRAFTASLLEEALLLQRIINDLQDLAAADAGQFRLHPEPVHVRDLLDQVAIAHRNAATAAGIALDVRGDDDPEIQADPIRLRQAVGNLVANALRHTPAGGTVTISCRRATDDLVIDVTDTGAGIAAADLPKIFDRFWRADKSRSRLTGGSGLGLPISRQLVEAHGGTLSVTSTEGEGAQFTIVLPTAPPA